MKQDRYTATFDLDDETQAGPLRRTEVMTGEERRRVWSADEKFAIIAESMVEGVVISDVARRYGLRPQQLFGWRSEFKARKAELLKSQKADFFAAIIDDGGPHGQEQHASPAASSPERETPGCRPGDRASSIEISVGRARIVIRGAVDQGTLALVLKTLEDFA